MHYHRYQLQLHVCSLSHPVIFSEIIHSKGLCVTFLNRALNLSNVEGNESVVLTPLPVRVNAPWIDPGWITLFHPLSSSLY